MGCAHGMWKATDCSGVETRESLVIELAAAVKAVGAARWGAVQMDLGLKYSRGTAISDFICGEKELFLAQDG